MQKKSQMKEIYRWSSCLDLRQNEGGVVFNKNRRDWHRPREENVSSGQGNSKAVAQNINGKGFAPMRKTASITRWVEITEIKRSHARVLGDGLSDEPCFGGKD